jgi:hypothetical protein
MRLAGECNGDIRKNSAQQPGKDAALLVHDECQYRIPWIMPAVFLLDMHPVMS